MYDMYKQKVGEHVSSCTFTKLFKSSGLKMKKPALDTCNMRDTYHMQIKIARSLGVEGASEVARLHAEADYHKDAADGAYEYKKVDKQYSYNINRVY